MSALAIDHLVSDVAADQHCGPELTYDWGFLELDALLAGRREQQYGDFIVPAVEPDWTDVRLRAEALLRRTQDLRLAVTWTLACTRLHGAPGLAAGLGLMLGLLERHGADLHPAAEPDDAEPRWQQLHVLRGLGTGVTLHRLRQALVAGDCGPSLRQIETTCQPSSCLDNESRLDEDALVQDLRSCEADRPGMLAALVAAHGQARALADVARQALGACDDALEPLLRMTAQLDLCAAAAHAAEPALILDARSVQQDLRIETLQQALHQIRRIDGWLLRTDARHPARLLLDRTRRLLAGGMTEAAPADR